MSAEVSDDFSEDEDCCCGCVNIEADKNFNIRALATSFVNYALELKGYEKERINENFECPKLLKKLRFLIYDKPCIENNKDEHIDNVENMFLKNYTKIGAAIKFIYCYERYFDVVAELFVFEGRTYKYGYDTIMDYVNEIESIAHEAIDDYINNSESIEFFEGWTEKMKEYRVLEDSDFYLTDNLKSNIELVKRLIEATSDSSKEVPQEEDILKFSSLSENDMNAIFLVLREENQEDIDRIMDYIDEIKSET